MQAYYSPTKVITGCGCLSALGKVAADYGERVMIVCGQSFAQRSGLLDRAIQLLSAEGLQETVFDGVVGEASLPIVEAGIALARRANCQAIVGLGGGSAIDTAKAIAGLEGPGLPFIAVPTTAGTGAEVTKNAVLIDPEQEIKKSIRDDVWFARVALVDPETTVSMPPQVTASTGSDALCQAIEAYTSIGASPVTDALAMRAISLFGHNLLRAYNAGDDIPAREAMSMGSLLAGMAMANARLGGVHGMAHPLGSHYHLPHGVVCGVLLPYTMEYNACFATEKYAVVARLMGENTHHLTPEAAAQKAIERVRELLKQVGIPVHLRELGVTEDRFDLIVKESLPSGSLKHNPRPLVAEDVRRILEMALGPAKAG